MTRTRQLLVAVAATTSFVLLTAFQNCARIDSLISNDDIDEERAPRAVISLTKPDHIIEVDADVGNDAYPHGPVRTIEEAMKRVRLKKKLIVSDIYVVLKGHFQLNAPLVFTEADGGTSTQKIHYISKPGSRATISGGVKLSQWNDAGNGILKSSVPGLNFRQLFARDWPGARPERARWPKMESGYLSIKNYEFTASSCSQRDDAGKLLSGVLASIDLSTREISGLGPYAFAGAELVILKHFNSSRLHTVSVYVDQEKIRIVPTALSAKMEGCNYPNALEFNLGYRAYFENSLEFIKFGGEWARVGETLFYKPRAGEQVTHDIAAPRLEKLLVIKGTPEAPVRNVVFSDLEFRHTTWNSPTSDGYIGGQAGLSSHCPNGQEVCQIPFAMEIAHAKDITLKNNRIAQLGTNGLKIYEGSENVLLENNHFHEISGTAIQVGQTHPDPYQPYPLDTVIRTNLIQHVALDYEGVGILVAAATNTKIQQNKLRFLNYSGISTGWFTLQNIPFTSTLIEANEISDFMQLYNDGGAIYTLPGSRGLKITNNYIHNGFFNKVNNSHAHSHIGLYLDMRTTDVIADKNYLHNLSEGLFLQTATTPDNPATTKNEASDDRAFGNQLTKIYMTSVDTPIVSQPLVIEFADILRNIIETIPAAEPTVAAAAGLTAASKDFWKLDLEKAPKGFFRVGPEGIYFSNGFQYCGYNTFPAYEAASGKRDTRLLPIFSSLPAALTPTGVCQ